MDGRWALAIAIVFAALAGVWVFRFEPLDNSFGGHRNRITGAICHRSVECWFVSDPSF
jgi:hypothetical protein